MSERRPRDRGKFNRGGYTLSDFMDEYGAYFQEYDPTQQEYIQEQADIRQGLLGNQLENIGTQRGFAQSSFLQNLNRSRMGAQNTLMDMIQQGQSALGQSGFAGSGAIQRASGQQQSRLRDRFGAQRENLQSQLEQQLNTLGQRETALEGQQDILTSQTQEDIYNIRQDYEDKLYGRLMDLIQSDANLPTDFDPESFIDDLMSQSDSGAGNGGNNDIIDAGKVICTEIHARGDMADDVYAADTEYAATLNPDVRRGYLAWANPLVRQMRKHPLLYKVVRPFGQAWAANMAYRMGVKARDNYFGRMLSVIGEPVCRAIGWIKRGVHHATQTTIL